MNNMKITTGIDIIEVDRIKNGVDELGEVFLNQLSSKICG